MSKKKKEARQLLKQKKAEQEEHLQWLEKKLQAEQEKQERLDTFELNSKTLKYSTYALIDPKNGKDIELENGRTYIVCYGTIGNSNVYDIGASLILSRAYNNVKGSVLYIYSIDKVKISLDGNILKVNTEIWLRLTINML